jgi:hypothetical protein
VTAAGGAQIMKHGGIVHRSTMILPYGIKTVLGYKYKKYMYFGY